MDCEVFDIYAVKLGIFSKKTILKAQELMRLVNVRSASGCVSPLHVSYTCRVIVCLELASLYLNTPFSKDIALRLAGVRKKIYQNVLQVYEQILELRTNITVKDIVLQFGCMEVVELAQEVLKCYESEMQKRLSATICEGLDLSQPVFAAASVCAACKVMKIRLDKRKLGEISRAKKSTFDKLCGDMDRHAHKLLEQSEQRSSRLSKTHLEKLSDSNSDELGESLPKKQKLSVDEDQPDDYETWKRKILEQME